MGADEPVATNRGARSAPAGLLLLPLDDAVPGRGDEGRVAPGGICDVAEAVVKTGGSRPPAEWQRGAAR